jgi:hypothetical protein
MQTMMKLNDWLQKITNDFRLVVLCALGLTVSTIASAATMEQIATAAGQLEGGYNRARFRCVADGIPMATYAEHYPDMALSSADLKSRYPEFFEFGSAKGVKQADRILAGTRQDFREGCAHYSNPKN